MDAERVLREARSLGLRAMEAGPDGFLPPEPDKASRLLSEHGLSLVGGFVPVVLHQAEARAAELESVERQARLFAHAGGEMLVISASTGLDDYEESAELEDAEWKELFASLEQVEEIGEKHGLSVVLHPHYGTVIEEPEHVWRFLEGCETGLCLDTGHSMVGGGEPVELVEQSAERVRHVHLKDVDRNLAEQVASGELGYEKAVRRGLFKPLGDGDVDIVHVMELLDGAGYEEWFVLEQDVMLDGEPGSGEGPAGSVQRSLAFLASAR